MTAAGDLAAGFGNDRGDEICEMCLAGHASQQRPELFEVVEAAGFGHAQIRVLAVGSAPWFATGSFMMITSLMGAQLGERWGLTGPEQSLLFAAAFVGIMLGNLLGGFVANALGHKNAMALALGAAVPVSFLTSVAPGFGWVLLGIFTQGICTGLGQPSSSTYVIESLPAEWRILGSFSTLLAFILAELFVEMVVVTDDPTMQRLHWRMLLFGGGCACAVWAILVCAVLDHPVSYFALAGQYAEATEVLRRMFELNGLPDTAVDFRLRRNAGKDDDTVSEGRHLTVLFGGELLPASVMLVLVGFLSDGFFAGVLYMVPLMMSAEDMGFGASPAVPLFVGSVGELIGVFTALCLGLFFARRASLMVAYLAAGLFTGALAVSLGTSVPLTKLSFYAVKGTIIVMMAVLQTYVLEVYPTSVRATASSMFYFAFHAGGFTVPQVCQLIRGTQESFVPAVWGLAAANLICCALVWTFAPETFGRPLRDALPSKAGCAGDCFCKGPAASPSLPQPGYCGTHSCGTLTV